MEQNINVYVAGCPNTPLEFELTRNQHMKELPGRPFTVTACFKEPPIHLHGEAWRILMHVCRGKELAPGHVQQYAKRALARSSQTLIGASEVIDEASASDPEAPPQTSRVEKSRAEGAGSASRVAHVGALAAPPSPPLGANSAHVEPHASSESGEDLREVSGPDASSESGEDVSEVGQGSSIFATPDAELSGEEPSDSSTFAAEVPSGVEVTPAVHDALREPHR